MSERAERGSSPSRRNDGSRTGLEHTPEKSPMSSSSSGSSGTSNPSPPLGGSSGRNVNELEMQRRDSAAAVSKKKKKKKRRHKKKIRAPGFDLTPYPGAEKNTVMDFMLRLKHAGAGECALHQLGVCFNTVQIHNGIDRHS